MTDPVSNTDELEPQDEAMAPPADATDEEGAVAGESAEAVLEDETPEAAGDEAEDEAGDDAEDEDLPSDEELISDEELGLGESLDGELLELKADFEALNDRHLRLAAEFNNYRRRVEQERLDLWGRAQADLLAKLLDVLDDLQRVAGLDLTNTTVEGIMEGIDLVERKFTRVLADAGVEVIDPVGEVFDPELMEAMMMVPAESEEEDDRVAQVFQKGYRLKGQLVRPARVSVHRHG